MPCVICVVALPSIFIIHRSEVVPLTNTNTSCAPSGEKLGECWMLALLARRVGLLPLACEMKMSSPLAAWTA